MVHNPGCTGCLTTLPTASYWNKWEVAAHEKRFQAASTTFSVANDVWNFLNTQVWLRWQARRKQDPQGARVP